jgi:GNAT superfamily N-acetyltransferase
VNEAELSLRRGQMGRSARTLLGLGPHSVQDQGPGYWVALSGAPSPELNMALVASAEPAAIATTLRKVEESGYPTLFMLAGGSRHSELGAPWQHVGDMPFMASAMSEEHLTRDERVRRATADDFEAVSELLGTSFGLARELSDLMAGLVKLEVTVGTIWLLVEEDTPVSTVLTSIVDDTVCVWCMATPQRFARRGYGRAILADVLLRAKLEGASIGLLGATPAGKALYDSTGWTTLEDWRMFLTPDAASAH